MTTPRVLVVGATGRMGAKIAAALLDSGARVRITSRDGAKPHDPRAELAIADLADADALARACDGVDVVVCAVQGLHDIIVAGQTRLLRAAERAGVARMIPSDYALDFFKTEPGHNRNLDLRRDFNATLDASPTTRGTSVLCGAFMELLAMGAIGPDRATGVFKVWGDPDQPYDFTATDDVARYIAAVALDPTAGRTVRVAGDTRSPRELAAIFADVRGTPTTIANAGSLADLDAAIERMRAADPAPTTLFPVWQHMQYMRDMASGRGRLAPLDNARYPAIRPTTVRALLTV